MHTCGLSCSLSHSIYNKDAEFRAWLVEDGYIEPTRIALSGSGAWMMANITVEEAEHLLGTEYFVYEHGQDGRQHVACHGAYHLPEHVSKHVDLITPTLHFDVGMRRHGTYDKSKNIGTTGFGAQPKMGGPVHVSVSFKCIAIGDN